MDFIIGGVAATCAGFFSNPFDLIKTRQQLQGELKSSIDFGGDNISIRNTNTIKKLPYHGMWQAIKSIVQSEGILGLQKGLVPALLFQFIMNGTRLGLYQTIDKRSNWMRNKKSLEKHSPMLCIFWGGTTGVVGAIVGSPLYMVKTQIQAQSYGKFAVGYQHQHTNTLNALITAYKEKQSIVGLWRGCIGTIPRAAIGSAVQLSTFTMCKDFFLKYQHFQNSTLSTAIASSMISGFFTVIGMTPFDVISTRLYNQGVDGHGKGLLYTNVFDCFIKTFKMEGVRGLYKGFWANYSRLAPHTIIHLTIWEQLIEWHKNGIN